MTLGSRFDRGITLILVGIAAIILAGFAIAHAQEPDDKPINAVSITPNGSSQTYAFFFPNEIHWFSFVAKEGLSYQIFTRSKKVGYPPVDTIVCLYDETFESPLACNDDFLQDGSSLIAWVCPAAGDYYIKVENYNARSQYGPHEIYSIQITSPDLQDNQKIIQGVPDYCQGDFGDPGNCGPVAAACVLGYWDARGYDLLVDGDPGDIEDVAKLVDELQRAMEYPSKGAVLGGVNDDFVLIGIQRVCNTPLYGNEYEFRPMLVPNPDFLIVMDEITYKRPMLYGVSGHSIWDDHWMVTVGYLKTATNRWTINHDTWSSTHRDVYVDWDEATDCIVTIQPGKRYVQPSGNGSRDTSFLLALMAPGFGMLPVYGIGFIPYSIMPTIPSGIWSSLWGGGGGSPTTSVNYPTTLYDMGGSISQQWLTAGGTGASPFIPRVSQSTFTGYGEKVVSNYQSATTVPGFSYGGLGGITQGYFPVSAGYLSQPFLFSSNPFFTPYSMPFFFPGVLSFPMIAPFPVLGLYPYSL